MSLSHVGSSRSPSLSILAGGLLTLIPRCCLKPPNEKMMCNCFPAAPLITGAQLLVRVVREDSVLPLRSSTASLCPKLPG